MVESLAPGDVRTFVFRVIVIEGMVGRSIGSNVAEVDSDQVDDPIVTRPVEPPGLSISKDAIDVDGPPLYEGDATHSAITVSNLSNDTTHINVIMQDAIP